eukprot:GEMP01009470.1.p1 GENE.GEMP01009470.1~~GEMP01009470.1.p1  ORF type:complete len:341 (+),score=60.67 GEMP01009470.1:311-1333(+)
MLSDVGKQLVANKESDAATCSSCVWFGPVVNMIGGLILSVVLFSSPVLRLYSKPNAPDHPKFAWWMPFGGVLQMCLIICVTIGFQTVGALLTTVQFTVANLGMSIIFDHFGFMSFPKRKVTIPQIVAVLFFLGAAILAAFGSIDTMAEIDWKFFPMPFLAGISFSFFLAFNVACSMALPFLQQSSLLNYSVSCPLALLIWGIIYAVKEEEYTVSPEWWTLLPGVIEIFMITFAFYLVPITGNVIYQQFFVTGQLVMGMIVDQNALLNSAGKKGTRMRYAGVALAIIAVIISVLFAPKAKQASADDTKADIDDQQSEGEAKKLAEALPDSPASTVEELEIP